MASSAASWHNSGSMAKSMKSSGRSVAAKASKQPAAWQYLYGIKRNIENQWRSGSRRKEEKSSIEAKSDDGEENRSNQQPHH